MKLEDCTFKVKYSESDGEFVGLCLQFPSLSWLDINELEALKGIYELVKGCLKDINKK